MAYPVRLSIEDHIFEVKRDGVDVPYLGRHIKRQAPTAKDYYLLKPGASHTSKVEISSLYDMSVTGDYSVRYHAASANTFLAPADTRAMAVSSAVAASAEFGELDSSPTTLFINGRLARGTVVGQPFRPQARHGQPDGRVVQQLHRVAVEHDHLGHQRGQEHGQQQRELPDG
ncbi:hypothetical protein LP420_29140 [Massilia sp. B-10]|nr:hypothetical protein LP420_29140 [Massilia sp. B-10]